MYVYWHCFQPNFSISFTKIWNFSNKGKGRQYHVRKYTPAFLKEFLGDRGISIFCSILNEEVPVQQDGYGWVADGQRMFAGAAFKTNQNSPYLYAS